MELGTLAEKINDPFTMEVKQSLSFSSSLKGWDYQKGRFNITLAIIDEYREPRHSGMMDPTKPLSEPVVADSMINLMPSEYDDFVWRLWIDLWCLIDAPLNTNTDSKMPSCYAEFGWSEHS